MNIIDYKTARTVATLIQPEQQFEMLKRFLGRPADRIEGEIYGLMRRLSPTFQQGAWRMYEVSNGSFYLAPDIETLGIYVERTSFAGTLSGDAAGLVVSLLGLRYAYRSWGDEDICTAFIRLRDFAREHVEGSAILTATD